MVSEKKQDWYSLEIETDANAVEAIEFALNETGADGIELDLLGKPPNAETVSVVGYFQEKPAAETWRDWLAEGLQIYGLEATAIKKQTWREVENKDWLEEWKKGWKPVTVGKITVAPNWSEIAETADRIIIRIEPGMAFGTGTHETTKLCLKAIQENYRSGESFFDVGTGTGILAMAVGKIDAPTARQNPKTEKSVIVGCDTDENSITIARENAALNGVENVEFEVGSITANSPEFDFVCANLTADVIIPLLPLLVGKAKKRLLLSGILAEQKELLAGELKTKFDFPESALIIETDGIWISILLKM